MADEPGPDEGEADAVASQEARPSQPRGRRRFKPGTEESADAPEEDHAQVVPPQPALAESQSVAPAQANGAQALEAAISEATANADMPMGPGDGLDSQRAADLIVMAETLQHREGISHVAFNFLVGEVCQALEQGLEAEDGDITKRWAQVYSRAYVSRLFRGLNSAAMFQRGWHSWRDETSGAQRRRRTFTLDLEHPVVDQVLKSRWGSSAAEYDDAVVDDGSLQEETATKSPVRIAVPFLSRFLRSRRGE